ncbi:MAG: protein-L-isoaspartate(D-aspartate) O-methyltransferase [Streptosporangiaceae bacterium]
MSGAEDLVRAAVTTGVRDRRVLDAVRDLPRGRFVPRELAGEANVDAPVPISHDQVTSQPSLVARMVEALGLTGTERVLEIGTGYGYQTALVARLAAYVVSIERWEVLAARARENLTDQGVTNVDVLTGDGSQGVRERAPYDVVIVSAAFPQVPAPLADQLRQGGRLVQPIGSGGDERVVLFERMSEELVRRQEVSLARFVPLFGRHGYGAG